MTQRKTGALIVNTMLQVVLKSTHLTETFSIKLFNKKERESFDILDVVVRELLDDLTVDLIFQRLRLQRSFKDLIR